MNTCRINARTALVVTVALLISLVVQPPPSVSANHMPLVSVTITKFTEFELADGGLFGSPGDFYGRVTINGVTRDNFSDRMDFPFEFGVGYVLPRFFEPFWTFSANVSGGLGTVPVRIEVRDVDDGDVEQMDLDPS